MDVESSAKQEEFRLPLELKTVLKTLKMKFWAIILIIIIGCALGVGAALLLGTQKYEATTALFYQPIISYVPNTFKIYQSVGDGTELSYEQGAGLIKFDTSKNSLWNQVNMVKTRPNLEELRKRLNLERTLEQLGASIKVYVAQDTALMFIAAQSPLATEAQEIANTIRDIFLEINDKRIKDELSDQLEGLEQQYERATKELQEAQTQFSNFIELYNISDIETQSSVYASELTKLELSITDNKQHIEMYKQRIERVKSEIKVVEQAEKERQEQFSQEQTVAGLTVEEVQNRITQLSEKIDIIRSNVVNPIELERLRNNLTIAENNYVKGLISRSEFEEASYAYKIFVAKTSQIDEIQKIKDEIAAIRLLPLTRRGESASSSEYLDRLRLILLENELELIRITLQSTTDNERYEFLKENFIAMPTIIQTYNTMNGNVISLKAETLGLEKILNQYKTIAKENQSNFYIISDAPIPLLPMESNKKMIAIVVAFLVIMIGFVILLISIIADTRIKSTADAKQKLNYPIIATFPYLKDTHSLLQSEKGESKHIELYRIMARPLRIKYPKHGATFLISSTVDGEGKSTTAINLATVFGRQDERVLLMDAQIRGEIKTSPLTPYIEGDTQKEMAKGLGEYLSYKATSEEIISQTTLAGVDMILKHDEAVIPDLLQSARMRDLMEELQQQYSIIIIEGPPVSECVDSEILSKYCDAIIMVTSTDKLKPAPIKGAISRLKKTNTPLEGIVLTKVRAVYAE